VSHTLLQLVTVLIPSQPQLTGTVLNTTQSGVTQPGIRGHGGAAVSVMTGQLLQVVSVATTVNVWQPGQPQLRGWNTVGTGVGQLQGWVKVVMRRAQAISGQNLGGVQVGAGAVVLVTVTHGVGTPLSWAAAGRMRRLKPDIRNLDGFS
jgi:hypothetical protein